MRLKDMRLKDEGYISLAGGCEVHGEVNISLKPVGEQVLLEVENHQYLYDNDSNPIEPFTFKLTAEEAALFMSQILSEIKSVSDWTEPGSTRDKSLAISFPMESESIKVQLFEYSMDEELDPIMEMIEDYILEHSPQFTVKAVRNITQEFLGTEENLKQAKIELTDAHMLWGGDNILVLLDGRVRLRSVTRQESPSEGLWEKRYSCQLDTESMQGIIDSLMATDLLTLELYDRKGLPDEGRMSITLTNYLDQTYTISVWKGSTLGPIEYQESPRRQFDKVYRIIKNIVEKACKNLQPEYSGKVSKAGDRQD